VSVVMVGGAPRPFIGARGGRGGGRLEGAHPVKLMVVGGHFKRGAGEPRVGLKGGGEVAAVSRRGGDGREAAARARSSGDDIVAERPEDEDEGGGAHASMREREGGGLGQKVSQAELQRKRRKSIRIDF
jgi:hypothetical protein